MTGLNSISLILFIAACINALIIKYLFDMKDIRGKNYFVALVLAITEWSLANALEYMVTDISTKILLTKLSYIGLGLAAPLLFMFTVKYTGRLKRFYGKLLVAIFLGPVITWLLIITNELHYLYWSSYSIVKSLNGYQVFYHSGVGVYFCAFYSYSTLLICFIFWMQYYKHTQRIYRVQSYLVIIAFATPWIFNIIYLLRILPFPEIDPTPIVFTLTGLFLFLAIRKVGLFRLMPLAKELLFETMSDLVFVIDSDLNITESNPSALKFFDNDSMIGHSLLEIFDLSMPLSGTAGDDSQHFEAEYIKADGAVHWFDIAVNKMRNDNNTLMGYLVVLRDITNRKNNELLMEKSQYELKVTNASKDKFFSIIAHDLKSPLSGVMTMLDYLSKEHDTLTDAEVADFYNDLNENLGNVYKLLQNLLEWSRLQMGRIEYVPDTVILSEVVGNVNSLLHEASKAKDISLISEVDETIAVEGDFNMLFTILRNFVSNAIKFTSENGTITIKADRISDRVLVSVKDTGIGMTDEIKNRLFKIEEKILSKGTAGESGTGLGLILCKEFVEKHGGKITVDTKVNVGTVFSFDLKLSQENNSH